MRKKTKKSTKSTNDSCHHSHPPCLQDCCLGMLPVPVSMWMGVGVVATEVDGVSLGVREGRDKDD